MKLYYCLCSTFSFGKHPPGPTPHHRITFARRNTWNLPTPGKNSASSAHRHLPYFKLLSKKICFILTFLVNNETGVIEKRHSFKEKLDLTDKL